MSENTDQPIKPYEQFTILTRTSILWELLRLSAITYGAMMTSENPQTQKLLNHISDSIVDIRSEYDIALARMKTQYEKGEDIQSTSALSSVHKRLQHYAKTLEVTSTPWFHADIRFMLNSLAQHAEYKISWKDSSDVPSQGN